MPANDVQVMEIFGNLEMSHPTVIDTGKQLISMYKAHSGEIQRITNEYNAAVAKIDPTAIDFKKMLDQGSIILQLMKMYPDIVPLIIQMLNLIAPHISETQKTLTELQAQAMQT